MCITAFHEVSEFLILYINSSKFGSSTRENDVFRINLIKINVSKWFVSFVIFDTSWAVTLLDCILSVVISSTPWAKMSINTCAITPPLFQKMWSFVSIWCLNIFSMLFLILHSFSKRLLNLCSKLTNSHFKACIICLVSLLKSHFLLDRKFLPSNSTFVLIRALFKSKLCWLTTLLELTQALSQSVDIAMFIWWKEFGVSFEVLNNWFQNCFLMSCDFKLGTSLSIMNCISYIPDYLILAHFICPSTSLLSFMLNFLVINRNLNCSWGSTDQKHCRR